MRPLRLRDAAAWSEVRTRNQTWLERWEGSPPGQPHLPWADRHTPAVFTAMVRTLRREARAGRALPYALTHEGRLVGQVTLSTVVRGAFDSATLGYWVDGALAGRGITPTGVALVLDHALTRVGLHRVEANVRPENAPSTRLLQKLGFTEEGTHRRYLHIDGAWRDHRSFALLREDVPEGVLARWTATHRRA